MENDNHTCLHCGKEFTSIRSDAKYCSTTCKQAAAREAKKLQNLTFEGTLIRGQHPGDVPPTGLGILVSKCRHCRKPFSHWMPSKLGRLVRNEVEGSIHWGARSELDQPKFDALMALRMEEIKFCSDECQAKGALSWEEEEVLKDQQRKLMIEDHWKKARVPIAENGEEKPSPRHRGQR